MFIGGTPEEMPEQYIMASPLTYVTKDDPPVLTLHDIGNMAIPFEQAELLDAKMKDVRVEHTMPLTKRLSSTLWTDMFDFLDKHLK